MTKILITGGTGLVGKRLTEILLLKKYEVAILSRNPSKKNEYLWDVSKKHIDEKALKNTDYIIHLAGAGIAEKRWSKQRKKTLIDSRVETANLLFEKIKAEKNALKGFISASGIGYYGAITSNKIFTENDQPANDFLSEICQKWEKTALQFESKKIATTIVRTGIVVSKKRGALEKMKTPIITPIGNGKQYLPWIHIDDLCQLYVDAIEGKINGIVNAIAPDHQTSRSFSKTLAKSVKRPFLNIGVPAFLLKIIFGELSILLLKGSRISSEKLQKKGFVFQFDSLKKALKN